MAVGVGLVREVHRTGSVRQGLCTTACVVYSASIRFAAVLLNTLVFNGSWWMDVG